MVIQTTVFESVERDLALLPDELATSGLAASALALALELDKPETSATSKAACARALREALDALRALAPPPPEKDGLDNLRQQASSKLKRKAK